MQIVVAPDSFKGTMTATVVAVTGCVTDEVESWKFREIAGSTEVEIGVLKGIAAHYVMQADDRGAHRPAPSSLPP